VNALAPRARVHVVGVAGAGMSGVARLLVEMGCSVSGSDEHESPVLGELRDAGVQVFVGHDAAHVVDAEIVLWSPAIEAVTSRAEMATISRPPAPQTTPTVNSSESPGRNSPTSKPVSAKTINARRP